MYKNMKKIFSICFCLSLIVTSVFAQSSAMVLGDAVRVRSEPGVQGAVIDSKQIADIVTVYEYAGTGVFADNIWDYWARIGDDQWINAYWISPFPVYYESSDEPCALSCIKSVSEDGTTVRVSNASINLPNASTREVPRNSSLFEEERVVRGYMFAETFYTYAQNSYLKDCIPFEECTEENRFDTRTYEFEGITVNGVLFPGGGLVITDITITTPDVLLMYGIHVGMTKDMVSYLPGTPVPLKDRDRNLYYSQIGYVRLQFSDNILTEIQYDKDL
ncbi:MAG: hypothetical protein MJ178_10380 [Treponemataceae bacterium]|nr:hypothetical protein [Treponemataceae bacterium]